MAKELNDFVAGDTKRWQVTWPENIAGAVIKFRMAKDPDQALADLEITATLDDPDVDGFIFGGTFEITPVLSAALDAGNYFSEHEMTLAGGEVGTFYRQTIGVIKQLPEGA
jgi:hypothetical protein